MTGALADRARSEPNRLAFAVAPNSLTYGQLAERAARLAAALGEAGVEPGDHVAILLPSGLDFILAFHAIEWLGAAAVPINPELPGEQVARRMDAVDCRFAVDPAALAELTARSARLAPRSPADPAPGSVAVKRERRTENVNWACFPFHVVRFPLQALLFQHPAIAAAAETTSAG